MEQKKKKTLRKYNHTSSTYSHYVPTSSKELTLLSMFNKFMVTKEAEGLTEITLRDYHKHIQYLVDFIGKDIPSEQVTLDLFRQFTDYMLNTKRLSPVTANVRIRTLRAFVRYCFLEGWITEPIHDRFKVVKTKEDTIESFTMTEIKSLINSVNTSTFKGFRDLAIIFTLLDTMIRCSELINIKKNNVDLKAGTILLESINTKTKKARLVPLSVKAIDILNEYKKEIADFDSEFLFLTYEGKKLSDNTVRKNLQELGKVAGITNKRVSPHTFRHTGALLYVLNGGDVFSLQRILGHSSMAMCRKYIQMNNNDVINQHNKFSPLAKL
ncbi:integrase/recombinase XerD [Sinobaca qinghaiensis]|uniref:Integrase/recombinase XerD n=1 Tax=Sinobaca qinghaiensis TaxID=342944 RepID=A0A419V5M1_9BACL|nr:tyrosine-type recombinase/integrase [Sinobaca qinghaiensis]RKD75249.1 integrase/recombinase XerD [Sinobaca qinghaiensis]